MKKVLVAFPSTHIRDLLWVILLPLSLLWAIVTRLRRKLSPAGYQSSLTVICIGNLHAGGSGKTPVVLEICKRFSDRAIAIAMRGYRGRLSGAGASVDIKRGTISDYGDEAWMVAQKLEVPVYIGKDRVRTVRGIEKEDRASIVIMDDGFQHLRFKANTNIVVINTDKTLESLFCIPLGELREPLAAVKAADAVVLNYQDEEKLAWWQNLVKKLDPSLKTFAFKRKHVGIFDANGNRMKGRTKLGVFCGIGSPESFCRDLESTGESVELIKAFQDHHWYTQADLDWLGQQGRVKAVEALVTTEKDWFKIKDLESIELPVWRSELSYEIPDDFWYLLEGEINKS